jgi:hypothetical protein
MDIAGLLRLPLADLVFRPWYDRAAVSGLANWYFPLSRAWAAALVADGSVARFAAEVPCEAPPVLLARHALWATERAAQAYEAARAGWEEAFFGPEACVQERLWEAEAARERCAQALMAARANFVPLHMSRRFPPVRWEVASEAEVERRHGRRLAKRERAFAPPRRRPAPDESRAKTGPSARTSWLRFPTTLSGAPDVAWARVARPRRKRGRATVIFTHGVAMEIEFWRGYAEPPAAFVEAGITTIRPEGPYHGRRRSPGRYGGEEVFARGPLGILDYAQAHVIELGLLTAWARQATGGPVAIGGVSLGALIAQLAAAEAWGWPEEMRPDALLLVTTSASVTAPTVEGSLVRALGVPEALEASGWTPERYERWLPLLEAGGETVVPPDRIVMTLGLADDITPYAQGLALARRWGVPEANVFARRQGHFTASLGLLRHDAPLRRLASVLTAG